jgi:hypothetical protein
MTETTNAKDYFSALFTNNNFLRYCFIAFAMFSSIFGTLGIYIIIQFERKFDKQRQTLLNKLAALALCSCIEFFVIVESTEIVRYFFGPLPQMLCFWQQVYRSYVTLEVMLHIDAIIFARYVFIFWLKNPAAFNDGFWFWFIFLWIKLSNRISQTSWYLLTTRQPVGYYICSGQNPTQAMKHPFKSYGIVEIFSILLHFAIHLRIFIYKRNQAAAPNNPTFLTNKLKEIKMADFTINIVSITILAISTTVMIKLSSVAPTQLSQYPTNILVYTRSLALPGLAVGTVCLMYFSRHIALQKVMKKKINDFFCRANNFT